MLEAIFRVLINIGIFSMLFWMLFWDSEPGNPIKKYWISKIQSVFVWLGLHANWTMFSPDPPQRTIWPKATLTMKNMDIVSWEPTPSAQLSLWEKIRFKKFHKFYHEVARENVAFQTKRDFVEYLLKKKLHEDTCIKVEIYMIVQPTRPFHERPSEETKIYKKLVYTFKPMK